MRDGALDPVTRAAVQPVMREKRISGLPSAMARPTTIASTRRDEIVADILAAHPALTVAEVLEILKEAGYDADAARPAKDQLRRRGDAVRA